MKKLILLLVVALFTVQFAVAQPAPAKRVAALNGQVGGTLTDEQKEQLTAAYQASVDAVAAGEEAKVANKAANAKVNEILTEEQKAARAEFAAKKKAK